MARETRLTQACGAQPVMAGSVVRQAPATNVIVAQPQAAARFMMKFPRFSGQAGRRGSRKDIPHAQDPSDLRQRLPTGSRQPPDQQPAPLEGGGGRTWSLGRLAADLASSSAPPRARSAGRKVVAESPWWSRPAEIRRLQRENEYLRRQREILKKAMSILSEVPQRVVQQSVCKSGSA